MKQNDELRRIVESEVEIEMPNVRLPADAEHSGKSPRRCGVCAWQRQQPAQPPQPLRCAYPAGGTIGNSAHGPAHSSRRSCRMGKRRIAFQHSSSGRTAHGGTGVAWRRVSDRGTEGRLLWSQHRGSSRAGGCSRRPQCVSAVVSRGGRPDLAQPDELQRVEAPTLLLVGGNDFPVIEMNRAAFAQLRCEKNLVIIPHATHLFEEPGALEEVADNAREWFELHLGSHTGETRAA